MKKIIQTGFIVFLFSVVSGCGGQSISSEADLTTSVSDLASQAHAMSLEQLEKKLKIYADGSKAKDAEIDALKEELKAFSPKEFLGEKAAAVKEKIATVAGEWKAYSSRYHVLSNIYQSKGGDVSIFGMSE